MMSPGNCDKMEEIPCIIVNTPPTVCGFKRCKSFCKAFNVVACTIRIIAICKPKGKKCSGLLTYEELPQAKDKLLCSVQSYLFFMKLNPFKVKDALYRVKGRLHQADIKYESKHLVITPPGHVVKLIIQFQYTLL